MVPHLIVERHGIAFSHTYTQQEKINPISLGPIHLNETKPEAGAF